MCAHPISPGNMLAPSKTAHYDWQLMRSKSELQKALHASTRNRQLKKPPMPAKRLKPMVVCACDNPNSWGCPGTMQGIVSNNWQLDSDRRTTIAETPCNGWPGLLRKRRQVLLRGLRRLHRATQYLRDFAHRGAPS